MPIVFNDLKYISCSIILLVKNFFLIATQIQYSGTAVLHCGLQNGMGRIPEAA